MRRERNRKYQQVKRVKDKLKNAATELGFEVPTIKHIRTSNGLLVYMVPIYRDSNLIGTHDIICLPDYPSYKIVEEFKKYLNEE